MKTLILALGGNALLPKETSPDRKTERAMVRACLEPLTSLLADPHYQIAIIHGNGPQVGNLLIKQHDCTRLPAHPLDSCGAQSQGYLGSLIIQELKTLVPTSKAVAVVTHVDVDPHDPAFLDPTKPIGPFYEYDTINHQESTSDVYKEDAGRGWRKVVPSPQPLRLWETESIVSLLNDGYRVICGGGGGIPMIPTNGTSISTEAVIDKDATASLLASHIHADMVILVTGVPAIYLNRGKPNQSILDHCTVAQLQDYYDQGQFPAGSMGPKVHAAMTYLQRIPTGTVIITDLSTIHDAIEGRGGTRIIA